MTICSYYNMYSFIPTFHFPYTKTIIFNTDTDNFNTISQYIKQYPSYKFIFKVIDSKNEAYGTGATSFVYDRIFKNFVDLYMTKSGLYFVDVNTDSFWNNELNIEIFVKLIAMCTSSNSILPYHLNPILLETITKRPMYLCELKYFMEQFDVETFKSCEEMSDKEFMDLGVGSVADYYRGRMSSGKADIYNSIANNFGLFDAMSNYDCCTIDRVFRVLMLLRLLML